MKFVDEEPNVAPDGYLYILEFSDGVTKVGCSASPNRRCGAHVFGASKRGVALNQYWISAPHRDYRATERSLIAAANRVGELAQGSEYFVNCDFGELAGEAERIPMVASSPEVRLSYQRQLEARGRVKTATWHLANVATGGIEDFLEKGRAAGMDWWLLAAEIYRMTEGQLKINPQTIRRYAEGNYQ